MVELDLQGTKLSFSILKTDTGKENYTAKTRISLQNEYLSYEREAEEISYEEIEEWIFVMSRLLAGAYGKEYNLAFERAGIAIDVYPYTLSGREATREERRNNDCIMAIRLLLRGSNEKYLGGVYSLILHREEIKTFVEQMREEYYSVYEESTKKGKYLFAGVSPKGYKGCNYWYLDKSGECKAGDYVWVRMGRHNTEQVVYVDNVRYFDDETAPYDPNVVKCVLRKAKAEEIEEW